MAKYWQISIFACASVCVCVCVCVCVWISQALKVTICDKVNNACINLAVDNIQTPVYSFKQNGIP
jgi:hypothetical protein